MAWFGRGSGSGKVLARQLSLGSGSCPFPQCVGLPLRPTRRRPVRHRSIRVWLRSRPVEHGSDRLPLRPTRKRSVRFQSIIRPVPIRVSRAWGLMAPILPYSDSPLLAPAQARSGLLAQSLGRLRPRFAACGLPLHLTRRRSVRHRYE
jgi:hypothetical protein